MGWLFEYQTEDMRRKDYAAYLLRGNCVHMHPGGSVRPVASSLQGNCFWVVLESYRKDTGQISQWIALFLLSRNDGCWGYKDMDEDMHPYFYTCPLKFLRMTKPRTQDSLNWRKNVRIDTDRRNARRREIRKWRAKYR